MPQQLLNRPQVSSTAQDMSGKAMPQGMGGNLPFYTRCLSMVLKYEPEALPGETLPSAI